uniref:hypothetical protein n=1 Tax=Burkholderia anthina TaxID=179879 RepID=UPI00158D97BF|nr:hypothetical protein [Burkholderia anthina]
MIKPAMRLLVVSCLLMLSHPAPAQQPPDRPGSDPAGHDDRGPPDRFGPPPGMPPDRLGPPHGMPPDRLGPPHGMPPDRLGPPPPGMSPDRRGPPPGMPPGPPFGAAIPQNGAYREMRAAHARQSLPGVTAIAGQ